MRWPRLTRRNRHVADAVDVEPAYRPGSWGQASLPPAEPDLTQAPTGNVEVIPPPAPAPLPQPVPPPLVAAPRAMEPAPRAAWPTQAAVEPVSVPVSAPDEIPAAASGVRLGFADGSDLQLDPDHPHSLALKAIADILLHRGPFHRRVS